MKPIYNLPYGGLECDGKNFLKSILKPSISQLGGVHDLA